MSNNELNNINNNLITLDPNSKYTNQDNILINNIDCNNVINSNNIMSNNQFFNNNKYRYITKEYNIKVENKCVIKKKIKYNNPDDYNKILKVYTVEPIIFIKTNNIILDYKTSKYIKFNILAPLTLGTYLAYIIVENTSSKEEDKIEEVLKFIIEVI